MGEIITFTRDEHRDRFLKFYKIRAPEADVGPGGEPHALASAHADAMVVVYGDAKTIGRNVNLVDATGEELLKKARAVGIDEKLPATGAEGLVVVTTATTGGTITEGVELKHKPTGLRFECAVTAVYTNGQRVPIRGIDTGTATNLPSGTVLEWTSPPPGINDTCTVYLDLQGGHPEETDDELIQRIIAKQKEPPASGNDAAYRKFVRETPGVPVEECWSYPAIFGPGTISVVFTIRTDSPLDSRIPNNTQITTVGANLSLQVPADDSIFLAILEAEPVDVQLGVTWAKSARGFVDVAPWPPYVSAGVVELSGSTSATAFTLLSATAIVAPQIGQTIAFYDGTAGKFRRKRILTVFEASVGTEWDITCDITGNASDTSFTPANGAAASPWSESLDLLVLPIAEYFKSLGPGEQVDPLPDPGRRQRRQSESLDGFPNVISNRDLSNAPPRTVVADVEILSPSTPYPTPVGVAGISSKLLTLGDLAVFVQ
jgi:Baseplate J-like protein